MSSKMLNTNEKKKGKERERGVWETDRKDNKRGTERESKRQTDR